MHLARSSYRLQLHRNFTFQDVLKIIPYLDSLGISTLYAAPFFEAMPGSMHGYDVINPLRLNPEIGTLEEFRQIAHELKARNMQWLQDIVPNHMAFSSRNPWIYDILEKGPHSPYYRFFDINWIYPDKTSYGKLMIPTLGASREDVIQNGELQLKYGDQGFYFAYYDHHFPASMRSYVFLSSRATEKLAQAPDTEGAKDFISLAKRLDDFVRALPREESAVEGWEALKNELLNLSQKYPSILKILQAVASDISDDQKLLEEQLKGQFFYPCHWQTTNHKINYRRFFTVNDLICLNMQEQTVFDAYHQFIHQLLDEDLIQGLRVDHVDGLLDPSTYLQRLRALAGDDTYITVEKILEGDESMPQGWPIEGSSGYDFLAKTNQLFTNQKGALRLLDYYQQKVNPSADYRELVFTNKRFILEERMAGDLDNLIRLMRELAIIPYEEASPDLSELKAALGSFLVYFPVYRTYSNRFPFSETDMLHIGEAMQLCESHHPELRPYLQRLREIFNGVADKSEEENRDKLYFNLRTQQFTGPLAAKGVEDTTFYQYFPLISLNEVGDSPEHLGSSLEDFHKQMQSRPLQTMNTTATHDTKRGEDVRLRLSVLSEIPEDWIKKVTHWQYLLRELMIEEKGMLMPDQNDAYFIFQTLVGTYPLHLSPEEDQYPDRLASYITKALREAKVHSNWTSPNQAYEQASTDFALKALQRDDFLADFVPFVQKVARTAAVYALGHTLLRITAPGVPDTYQGTEYWDLSMVDPDNRRPVNYQEREEALLQIESAWQASPVSLLHQLQEDLLNPRIKLFTLYHCLNTRKLYRPLFDRGAYQPVEVINDTQASLLAFRRVTEEGEALVLLPLGITPLEHAASTPLGEAAWKGSRIVLGKAAGEWQHIFLNQKVKLEPETSVASLLHDFPVALLIKT